MSPRRWRRLCAVEWGGLLTGEVLAGRFFGESAGDEMRVVEAGFGVAEFVAVEGGDTPAGSREYGVASGDVPFHGAPQARVEVGFASGDEA